jgi:acyl-CoA reductase-like NAD-dependent aldehyde dehydrogenase
MTINGGTVATADSFEVVDPATGQPFATAPACDRSQLDRAVGAARRAFGPWSADEDARVAALTDVADAVDAGVDDLALLLSREQGKPLAAARYEVTESTRWLRASARLDLPTETLPAGPSAHARLRRRPLGVVAAITPWNFPLLLAAWKIGPALRAGNTMILKPSPYTPLSSLLLGELVQAALPAGVLNVVSGPDDLGAWLTAHPGIAKISFTGSVATGKTVMTSAARDLKRVTLELGGNDAAIVLADADPQVVGKGLFWGSFTNCGQVCAGIKRIFVPESMYDSVVDDLAARADRVRVGPGTEPGVQMGPIQNRAQLRRVAELVDDAVRRGAVAAAGGHAVDGPGFFYRPTVLRDVTDDMPIVAEEQFGPAIPVLSYRTVDEAVSRANDSVFGLSASVWGTDLDRAEDVAARLEVGTAFVNDHLTLAPELPFGGAKSSGIGVENGQWGLDEFTRLQVLHRPVA